MSYTHEEFVTALKKVGIKEGNVVFSHSNIGYFGFPKEGRTAQKAFEVILGAFLEVLGQEGTLVVPTFTYSFQEGGGFDPEKTPSICGIFAEKLRCHPDSFRSDDPSVSVCAIGKHAQELTQQAPVNAYGKGSFFDRFYHSEGIICNLNFDAGSTFIHYVERELNVPYRFDKTFEGFIQTKDQKKRAKSTIWVRQLEEGTIANFENFDALAREKKCYRTAPVGRGFIGSISAKKTYQLIKDAIHLRPWILTNNDKNSSV